MALGSNKFLGLSLGDRSIQAAQVRVSGDKKEVSPAAEFVFPDDLTWEKPEAVGKALRHFLRHNHFSASHAVVGVPARWMLAREKECPPASASVAANVLRLQAEQDFPSDLELVYDYAGQSDSREPRKVLLVAMLKRHMDRIVAMADEAGLSLKAVSSSSLVLASAAGEKTRDMLSLVLAADSAELVIRGQTAPKLLKHVSLTGVGNGHTGATLMALGSEVQRAVAMSPPDEGIARTGMLWDGVGLETAGRDALIQRGGIEMRIVQDLADLGVTQRGHNGEALKLGAAVALALAGAKGRPTIDFAHARLAPPKVKRINRTYALAGVAAAALVGVGIWQYMGILKNEAAVAEKQAILAEQQAKRKEGDPATEKALVAKKWSVNRSPVPEGLRDMANNFPTDNRVFATQLMIRDKNRDSLVVKVPTEFSAEQVKNDLKKAPTLDHPQIENRTDPNNQARPGIGRSSAGQITIAFDLVRSAKE
jgi:hypothetical protein